MTERRLPINSIIGTQTTVVTNTTTIICYINGTDVLVNWTSIIENNGTQTEVETYLHTELYNQLYERANVSIETINTTNVNRTDVRTNVTITTVNGSDTTVDNQYSGYYNSISKGPCVFPFKVQDVIKREIKITKMS